MLNKILAAAAVAMLVCAAPTHASELKLAHFMSPQHPMDRHVMTPLAERVAATSNGELTINIYPGGELGAGPNQQYRRAVTGIADIAFNLPQYTPAQFKRSVLLHVPGLFTSPEQATATIWDKIDALNEDFSEVKLLAYWTNNPSILFTRERAVRTLADMNGLKVRIPDPVSASIVEAWGAIPVSLPATETYNALSTGIVDAVLIDASAVGSYKLHEITKYVTTDIPGALSTFTLIMNKGAWDGLSEEQRGILAAETGKELSMEAAAAFKGAGNKGMEMLAAANIELIELGDTERAAFVDAMQGPVSEFLISQGNNSGFDGPAFVDGFRTAN
ncbi:MAG: TRAP transporter substrate-binding protein [Hyphomicrobiales bacterium]|nr:TRAP transporter substrate-binding protein [Hyphomicrobiales bacterium]